MSENFYFKFRSSWVSLQQPEVLRLKEVLSQAEAELGFLTARSDATLAAIEEKKKEIKEKLSFMLDFYLEIKSMESSSGNVLTDREDEDFSLLVSSIGNGPSEDQDQSNSDDDIFGNRVYSAEAVQILLEDVPEDVLEQALAMSMELDDKGVHNEEVLGFRFEDIPPDVLQQALAMKLADFDLSVFSDTDLGI